MSSGFTKSYFSTREYPASDGFADHDFACHAVIFAVSIAIDDSDQSTRFERRTQVAQRVTGCAIS